MDNTVYSAYGSVRELCDIVERQQVDIRTDEEQGVYNGLLEYLYYVENVLFNIGVRNGTIV